MAGYWISLPVQWKLQDVQATLNVIITQAARQVAQNHDVSLHSLLSLNTLGEAVDALFLLKTRLLESRYLAILAQCAVVAILSGTDLLLGPIARYSVRRWNIVRERNVPGFLASSRNNGLSHANVEWNFTYTRLDSAGAPRNELLDYIPDNEIVWVYNAAQWNNSWSFDCQETQQTPIKLHDSGNCTELRYEVPELDNVFGWSQWDGYWYDWDGFYDRPDHSKDVLLFIYGANFGDYDKLTYTHRAMNISLLAVHLHDFPRNQNGTNGCNFGAGDVGESSYTAINCALRQLKQVPDALDSAFPDVYTNEFVPQAFSSYYQARFTKQSTTNSPISVITPPELMRFYQVYTIVKDIQLPQPVTRRLSVELRVVQLSAACLSTAMLAALLILLGIAHYAWFAVFHRSIMFTTPQSKLDWMMQSIQTEDRPLFNAQGRPRWSVTTDSTPDLAGRSSVRRKRREFEAAKYGGRATTTWFLRDSTATTEYGASPRLDEGIGIGLYHSSPRMVQGDKMPMLNVSNDSEEVYPQSL